jgi:predicted RecB family nuclease
MRNLDGAILFSASDLVNFMGCGHATRLDLANLTAPRAFPPDDPTAVLLQEKGIEHERAYLARLKEEGRSIVEIAAEGTPSSRAAATVAAMRGGADVVYQGAFIAGRWHGYSDFVLRVDGVPSRFGDWSYDVADTKLARSAKPKHVLQLCVYADLVAECQGAAPKMLHVVLGDGSTASVPFSAVSAYAATAKSRFESFVESPATSSSGEPCGHCTFCRWSTDCDAEWESSGHLSLVAGMTRTHAGRLQEAGVTSLADLAAIGPVEAVGRVRGPVLARLRSQAELQHHYRTTGERRVELLPFAPGLGLGRLPLPDAGDMFLDLEGDPLFDGGLEYLFGLVTVDGGAERFHEFWAHDRAAEKVAFEGVVDLISGRLGEHPGAHIYHYASYEVTAFKRLAMFHGTREAEVDDFLRQGRLIDLYQVVRESMRTSEPSYSIKSIERFYLPESRSGEVTTAGDSIVMYERWRSTGDDEILTEIGRYNEFDCVSTLRCRDWLVGLRPGGMSWASGAGHVAAAGAPADDGASAARREAEARSADLAVALIAGADAEPDFAHRRLVADLLEFHRREAKPTWWAMFDRRDRNVADLVDDAECLADLRSVPGIPPRADKRSMIYTFTFPAQDFKLKVEDKPLRAGTLEPVGEVVAIDEDARLIELKLGPSRSAIVDGDSLIPSGPVGDKVLRDAVHRYANALVAHDGRYRAVDDIIRRAAPRLGDTEGPVVPVGVDATAATIDAVARMQDTFLLVQGPPGAGKTFTSAHAIVSLLAAGRRVAVASNGHKAINNLLAEVERLATERGLRLRGVKKSSRADQMLGTGGWIEETLSNEGVLPAHQLVAGTAWLFARPELDQAFDHLFIDEAGQVSLANVVAMGVSARNVVLVGDQMQLSQPVKGTHPRGSGASALDHVLEGRSTVPDRQGVFLPQTRRMHPDLCAFVSAAFYDGRLSSSDDTARQRIDVDPTADPEALAPSGLRFVDVDSVGCTQRSEAEAARIASTFDVLMCGTWTDRMGRVAPITPGDVLVVTPYNMQVDLLRRTLPTGARVGTVDKFQGQEAAVVLISMVTSSGDDLPRDIEFLYSLNRLNVAVSRARCLAVIYANPLLLQVPCGTVRQMTLVNGLCRAKAFRGAAV